MLLNANLGTDMEEMFIVKWIVYLNRDSRKMWSKEKNHVKDFRACQDFFDIILDGTIIAFTTQLCGNERVNDVLSIIDSISSKKFEVIEAFANRMNDFCTV